jgi:hypothetical protein
LLDHLRDNYGYWKQQEEQWVISRKERRICKASFLMS